MSLLTIDYAKRYINSSKKCKAREAAVRRYSSKQVFFKKFTIFTGKHQCWTKVCCFIKKRLQYRCFPQYIAKFLRTAFLIDHLWWLFLVQLIPPKIILA